MKNKLSKGHRVLALCLTALLCVSLVRMTAFASEPPSVTVSCADKIEKTNGNATTAIHIGTSEDLSDFFLAIKQAGPQNGGITCWTGTELTAAQKTAIQSAVLAKDGNGMAGYTWEFHVFSGNQTTPFRIFPSGTTGPLMGTARIYTENGNLYFQMQDDKWSHLFYGSYTTPGETKPEDPKPEDPKPVDQQTLTVVKEIPAEDFSSTQALTLTFTLTDANGGTQTKSLTVQNSNFTLSADGKQYVGTVSFENLASGQYTVTETSSALPQNCTVAVTSADGATLTGGVQAIAVAAGTNTLTFRNDYTVTKPEEPKPEEPKPEEPKSEEPIPTPPPSENPVVVPETTPPTTNLPDVTTPSTEIPDTTAPTTELPEPTVPTATFPGTDIPDDNTPLASVPKTGDSLAVWLAVAAASALGLAGLFLSDSSRRKTDI